MGIHTDLENIDRDKERQEKLRRDQEQAARVEEARARDRQLAQENTIKMQRMALVEQWNGPVSSLLTELGNFSWSKEAFAFIPPDQNCACWCIAHAEGKATSNYEVELLTMQHETANLTAADSTFSVTHSGWRVTGQKEEITAPDVPSLKIAVINAYRYGPKPVLSPWAKTRLANMPYRPGEYDARNYWILIPTILTGIFSFGFIVLGVLGVLAMVLNLALVTGEGDFWTIVQSILLGVFGLAGLVLTLISLRQTAMGRRFTRLPTAQKVLAGLLAAPHYLASLGSVAIGILIVVALIGVGPVIDKSIQRAERVDEMTKAVETAMRRAGY